MFLLPGCEEEKKKITNFFFQKTKKCLAPGGPVRTQRGNTKSPTEAEKGEKEGIQGRKGDLVSMKTEKGAGRLMDMNTSYPRGSVWGRYWGG